MTLKDKSTIQRMLGKIEGVTFALDDKTATPLRDAIEVIDCILDREDETDNDRQRTADRVDKQKLL